MPKVKRAQGFARMLAGVRAKKAGKEAAVRGETVSRYYPADDVKVARPRNFTPGKTKLRASITPGTVLILLAGRHRGKRVVFLKQLPSGLLLVTGPYKINGCPVRRVNQAYVIATSTKVDAAAAKAAAEAASACDDEQKWFKRDASSKKDGEEAFFEAGAVKEVVIPEERKTLQKSVDGPLLAAIKNVADLKAYLNAKFSLSKGDRPHEMVF